MMNWSEYEEEERANARSYWQRIAILLLIAFGIVGGIRYAYAEAIAVTGDASGAKITIYTEPCAFKDIVALTNRATWEEKGKVFEGCVGDSQMGVLIFYFPEDKSVFPAPKSAFKSVSNA